MLVCHVAFYHCTIVRFHIIQLEVDDDGPLAGPRVRGKWYVFILDTFGEEARSRITRRGDHVEGLDHVVAACDATLPTLGLPSLPLISAVSFFSIEP